MTAAGTSTYPAETIEAALTALALHNGNARLAHEAMTAEGLECPNERTLRRWRTTSRYAELHDARKTEIEQAAIRQWREITVIGAHAQMLATERAIEALPELDAKDASTVAKNIAIASGVAADKLLVFTDRPNQITEHRDPDQILRQLESLLGTAEEVPPEVLTTASVQSNPRELDAG